ncbi:MAG: nitric oxide-sensing transcriptional repressor NsrR [Bacillota bacterium]|uniref:HTH-type transcriptional regulator NsrR n=1 Tax=Virgibacillus salarius TaxID=447199 RepID=A0A941E1J8_9BACI|nr:MULTISPECIES: nitric oxide-sensing transcriptional repressor NsrR [Bacillaceae]NAZ09922.1 nitric oxide-sensing transcriptional repressor NsrR [Agaribacter marinus]MBR7797213.1 nitric oxide-sensing transcriptional repressor NsrR [Virgibacillus salarius]MCC2250551.1 nitric oxide-sensing transcriptional repressor NsrR [Virgibacillus sp. AGTR]MDY7045733.1 nitric oxide-sensing transcriptional repressor NsrR [Virgibacillus sp. M23]QRZ19053.1 nitric oxide-sensing transcriptional repressor NsrR [Vi
MNLKKYTDYALRVLIFTGMKSDQELATIKEISEVYTISQEHVRKVVHELVKMELIESVRGRHGGIRMAKPPEEINVGRLVRQLEADFVILECFDKGTNHCVISPGCTLKHVLNRALVAFFKVLEAYTLKDLIKNEEELRELMGL